MKPIDPRKFTVSYHLITSLSEVGADRYNQCIEADVSFWNDETKQTETVGFMTAHKLLLNKGLHEGWDACAIFETDVPMMEIGDSIYDFEKNDWHSLLKEEYGDQLTSKDILVLRRIEIIPKYRKTKLAGQFIKDLYSSFMGGADLFIINCFPPQFEKGFEDSNVGWTGEMEYNTFGKDLEQATYKLLSRFHRMGFEIIPELSGNLMFINASIKNPKFDEIVLK